MTPALLVVLGAVLLLGIWLAATSRHHRSRTGSEWADGGERPDLWTSAARCVRCGADGGVLELQGDDVRFVCLRCGAHQQRETRG